MQTVVFSLSKLPVIVLLLLSAGGVVLGDYFAKQWSLNPRASMYFMGFFGYLLGSFFYIPSLLKESLVVTSIIWSLLSIIGFLFIGLVVFKETINTIQMIGVMIGIVALVILTFGSHGA